MNYHVPVLLHESVEGLNIVPNGTYVDATFGGGGHSSLILKKISKGTLFGFDQDEDAKRNIPDNSQFVFVHHNFRYIKRFLRFYNVSQVDGILADLGVSSHHFDTPERGFSFRFNAALDMRMDCTTQLTARDVVNTYEKHALTTIFREYGELSQAHAIASAIVQERTVAEIVTTEDLKRVCKRFCNPKTESKILSQLFQALRIEVNKEMDVLQDFLQAGLDVLKPGGRFVIITYHSLEDRMVKNFFKTGNIQGQVNKDFFGNSESPFEIISKKIIVPSADELQQNNRARSAKLRIAQKI
ncbi:MAG TPA: 16S rRNA (cytosine(1402)-N(4))-methyltransferase RsmH [Bacteroidales bacterium]|nr:MAG: Ribosomal RNA small subunit methyltransferase H [Bacteroidetes bacterium ADurb.Bin217]HPH15778.1 16S rRNA (cytosine(1402)-N(4))-methyltransferase RsmH [Bacteroidales bacterium]HPM12783.1 16S rRNA (cytosine(1402)-N(4))-methyltransferase RsmH [Bacteroidales bacterium]